MILPVGWYLWVAAIVLVVALLVAFDLGAAGSVVGDRLLGVGSHAVVVREVPPAEAAPGGS